MPISSVAFTGKDHVQRAEPQEERPFQFRHAADQQPLKLDEQG